MKRKADEEEAFQRGAAQEPETGTERRKPARPKGKRSKVEGEEVAPEPAEPFQLQRRVSRLRTADLVEGSLIIGAVRDITEEDLTLCLAYNLLAYVQRAEASDGSPEVSRKSLAELYRPGMLVVAVVLTVGEMRGQKLRIEASLRPALVNAGLTAEHLRRNMWLPAAVAGDEEHVLKLDFGVGDLTGLLKKKEFAGEKMPHLGSILLVGVAAVTSSGTVRCMLACKEPLSDDPIDAALLKAGSLVTARVRQIQFGDSGGDGGLTVTFCGMLSATIHRHHASHASMQDGWKKNQRLVARILSVIPGETPTIHLTLLPHLLDWEHETLSQQAAIGEFLTGEVQDFQPKYGLRVSCEGKAGEVFGFCSAARLGDATEDVKASSVAVGHKSTYRVLSYNFLDAVVTLTRRPSDLGKDVIVSVSELAPGQLLSGIVTRVADHGIHVKISDYVSGHVHLRQLTDVPLAAVPKRLQVGSKVKCRVLHVHATRRQLTLTAKKSLVKSDFQLTQNSMARPHMLLTGYISSIHDYGAIVSFYGGAFGLIPTKDMESEEAPALGMAVQCRVAFVDVKRDRVGLSLNPEDGVAASELLQDGLTFGEFLKRQAAEKRSKRAAASDGTALKDGKPRKERKEAKLPQIKDPEKELQAGSPLKMRIRATHGLQVFCTAPVGLRGHVHATQLVDLDDVGSGGTLPLQDIPEKGILRTRLLRIHKRSRSSKEKGKSRKGLYHLVLTCRPSLMAPKDATDYEAAIVRRQSLAPGSLVAAAILTVQKNALMVEVADGLKGRIGLLDTSADPSVLRYPAQHFTPGQVFQSRVLQTNSSHKTLDLSLLPLKQSPVLGRLQKVHDPISKGVAADLELPNRCWGTVHITEVFDVWTQHPAKRLSLGSFYEVAILSSDFAPGQRLDVSLRPSLVQGHKEAAEEKRPASVSELAVGQRVSGYVVSSGPRGVFVALSRLLTGRIKLRALSDVPVMKEAISKMYPAGMLLRDMAVAEIDQNNEKVELSLLSTESGLTVGQLTTGDIVSGRVKAVEAYGLFIRLDNSSIDAFVHKSEISDSASIGVESYPVGTKISQAKILKIDGRRVGLTLKASSFTAQELEGDDSVDEFEELLASASAVSPKQPPKSKRKDLLVEEAQEEAPPRQKKQRVAKAETEKQAEAEEPDLEPWKAKGSSTSNPAAFDFAEFKVDSGTSSDAAADDPEENETGKLSKRQKKAKKKQEEKVLRQQEDENAVGRDPESVEDFERLLLTKGDTSILWIRYMAFHLKTSDLEKARQVAERAVKHVGFADGKERLNVWVAFLNLECTFGTDASADQVFRRAASHNEAKQVYLQLARIHERNKKPQLALKAYEACSRKFAHSKKVWIAFLTFLYQQGDAEGARKVLPKSLAALEKRKHPLVVSKTALLEYQTGSPDRGRSIFEGLMDTYPKRTDLWSVYLDAHIKAFTPPKVPEADHDEIRALFRRCCSMSLKATKMRFFFKRWLDFETRWGDAESLPLRALTMVAGWLGLDAMRPRLSAYEVGVTFLLLRFAEDQGEPMVVLEVLIDEVRQASPDNLKTLSDLQRELCASKERMEVWQMLIAGLYTLTSPDALFELFRNLESMICRELVSASVMHSSGAFGQLARRFVLAFKQSSFEEIIKLYDAVESFRREGISAFGQLSFKADSPETGSAASSQQTVSEYMSSVRSKFADSAAFLLRCFHDQRSSVNGQQIQHAVLGLANLSLEMRNLDDALQALEDSIRAAQESSDANCLCAGMYLLSNLLLSNKPSMAAALLRRCLHRSEALGLPLLESLSSLALARILALQPSLATRPTEAEAPLGPGGESMSPALLQGAGAPLGSLPSRAWAFLGKSGARGSGFGVLAALSTPGREVLAHVSLASLLSTQAGTLELLRPKVLLCQAGVSQRFGLSSSASSCQMVLDIYKDRLGADDRALAFCQLADEDKQTDAMQVLSRPDLSSSRLWVHAIGRKMGERFLQKGLTEAFPALLFQTASAHANMASEANADKLRSLRFQKFSNQCRLHSGNLLATNQSAREAWEGDGKASSLELCESLLTLTQVNEETNPVQAVASCVRCMSLAEAERLRLFHGEALLRLAKLKLELGDILGALQLTEESTSHVLEDAKCRVAELEAESLLELSSRLPADSRQRSSVFEAVLERLSLACDSECQSRQRRCHYLMARTCHARSEHAFVNSLLEALSENAKVQIDGVAPDGNHSRGPIWENPWDDRDQMRLKLHELGTTLKRYGSYGLASLICELSLVVWQLRAWFTIGAGLLVVEVLKRISEMHSRLPSAEGQDPGLAALRVIEGFILFCAARHKRIRKDATAALERILLKKRLPPCTSVRIEAALVSVGWQKGAVSGLQKPHLLDNAGEDWLNELAMALKPNAEAEAKMTRTREMLQAVVQSLFPGAQCDYFGSAVNGFETRLSDIDAVIVFSKEDMERLSQRNGPSPASSPALKASAPPFKGMALARRLQKESAAVAVRMMGEALVANKEWGLEVKEMVTEARVPVLKCASKEGVAIDITFNNLLPLYNSKLLKAYASLDDRVARLGRLVKFWAKSRMVNDALEGTLSSYSHCLLLIHFLQSVAVLPNLQDTSGIPDAAERAKFGDIDLFDGVHDVWFLDPGRLPQSSERWKNWASKSPVGATLRGLLANFFWYLAYEVPAHSDVLSIRLPSRIHKEVYFRDMLQRKKALGQDPVEPVLEPLDTVEEHDCELEEKVPEHEDHEGPEDHEEQEVQEEVDAEDLGKDLNTKALPETLEPEVPADLSQKYKLPAEQHELQQAMSTRQTLCIDDPMELGRSLGASFQGFERLCYEWRRAYHLLSEGPGDDIQRLRELFCDKPAPPRSIYTLEKQRAFPTLVERADRDRADRADRDRRGDRWTGTTGTGGSGRSWYSGAYGKGPTGAEFVQSTAYPGWRGQKGPRHGEDAGQARAGKDTGWSTREGDGKGAKEGKDGKSMAMPMSKGMKSMMKGQAEGKGLWQ
ncbi:rrp5 [Symbiodinium necroappetens]|uniref:Rrp5 protein n=1 Tax=Symbiodinium necroappetens TaxID=1628268 RepID=A0A812JME2_9DINO|nr:rrp5 [Symbiodinium necroappetens]